MIITVLFIALCLIWFPNNLWENIEQNRYNHYNDCRNRVMTALSTKLSSVFSPLLIKSERESERERGYHSCNISVLQCVVFSALIRTYLSLSGPNWSIRCYSTLKMKFLKAAKDVKENSDITLLLTIEDAIFVMVNERWNNDRLMAEMESNDTYCRSCLLSAANLLSCQQNLSCSFSTGYYRKYSHITVDDNYPEYSFSQVSIFLKALLVTNVCRDSPINIKRIHDKTFNKTYNQSHFAVVSVQCTLEKYLSYIYILILRSHLSVS